MRSIRIITPPTPAVLAAEAKAARVFAADDADSFVDLLLAAAQSQIDGPGGVLGLAIGEQELELVEFGSGPWGQSIRLPCPPIIEIVSVKYDDADGVEHTVDPADYLLSGEMVCLSARCQTWPAKNTGIRFKAGYQATSDNPPKSTVPAAIKHAIILMAAELRSIGQAGGIVRREQVEGVGSFDYAVPDLVAKQLAATADRLLAGFKVYRV